LDKRVVLKLVFKQVGLVDKSSSFLDYFSLLLNRQMLNVIKTDTLYFIIEVGLVPTGLHVETGFIVIPENFMRHLILRETNYFFVLLQIYDFSSPALLSFQTVLRLEGNSDTAEVDTVDRTDFA
jgi:hypothetical protein